MKLRTLLVAPGQKGSKCSRCRQPMAGRTINRKAVGHELWPKQLSGRKREPPTRRRIQRVQNSGTEFCNCLAYRPPSDATSRLSELLDDGTRIICTQSIEPLTPRCRSERKKCWWHVSISCLGPRELLHGCFVKCRRKEKKNRDPSASVLPKKQMADATQE